MTTARPLLTSDIVYQAFVSACREELSALKPGNVHIHADGHNMTVADFEAAAVAAAPSISRQGLRVGIRIEQAVMASYEAVGCNTNLGIILLSAPVATAVLRSAPENLPANADLRTLLAAVLADLDTTDAIHAFRAIAHVNPGGLGDAPKHDVHQTPETTLRAAMNAAAHKDRIANAYKDNFSDIFGFGLPLFAETLKIAEKPSLALTTLHMAYLARFPDTHITRKSGTKTAKRVQKQALELQDYWYPAAKTENLKKLLEFDAQLKSDGLNPGTTADFVVATLFLHKLATILAQIRYA